MAFYAGRDSAKGVCSSEPTSRFGRAPAVLGGAGVAMFGMVAAAGIKILAQAQLQHRNNSLVVAVSIGSADSGRSSGDVRATAAMGRAARP